jgi:hypothetical protein
MACLSPDIHLNALKLQLAKEERGAITHWEILGHPLRLGQEELTTHYVSFTIYLEFETQRGTPQHSFHHHPITCP